MAPNGNVVFFVKGNIEDIGPLFPPSPYQLFMQEVRPTLSGTIAELAKQITRQWATMDPVSKRKYEDKAKILKSSYDKDFAEYRSTELHKVRLSE